MDLKIGSVCNVVFGKRFLAHWAILQQCLKWLIKLYWATVALACHFFLNSTILLSFLLIVMSYGAQLYTTSLQFECLSHEIRAGIPDNAGLAGTQIFANAL
jgi:hypothetical protein